MNRKTLTIGFILANALGMSALVLVASPASASSSPAARYGVINATVDAATDHEIGTSTAFPNFTNGAIDNYYSLAHSHIDNSPFAEGTASPADTGPVGQTGAAQAGYQQPQYADARWPGAKSGQTASFGNAGGPSASAKAGNYKAQALSSELSDAGAPSGAPLKIAGPKGFKHRLHLALAVWKARWLHRLHLPKLEPNFADALVTLPTVTTPTTLPVTVPTTVPTLPGTTTSHTTTTHSTTTNSGGGGSSKPPSNGALISTSLAEVDPHSRAVVTSGESSLGTVQIGGGQIVLKNIHVTVKIVNNGHAKGQISVSVGEGTIGGVPVTIDEKGVHVAGQGSGLPYGQADDALNGALKTAGVQLYTVTPQVKKSKNELSIDATGVHVAFAQPVQQSGVPSQTVDHIVGEVFADSLAAPAPPVPKLPHSGGSGGSSLPGITGGGGSTGVSSGGTSFGSGSSSSSSSMGSTGSSTGGSSPTSFLTGLGKPGWLLAAYLVWTAIMLATGASLWRWREGGMTA